MPISVAANPCHPPRKHHFVPAGYFRLFMAAGETELYCYDKGSGTGRMLGPKGLGMGKDIFGTPDDDPTWIAWHEHFRSSNIEAPALRAVRRFNRNGYMDDGGFFDIMQLAVLLLCVNPLTINDGISILFKQVQQVSSRPDIEQRIVETLEQEGLMHVDVKSVLSQMSSEAFMREWAEGGRQQIVHMMLGEALKSVKSFARAMEWQVEVTKNLEFITSDRPALHHPTIIPALAWARVAVPVFYMPLTPRACLVGTPLPSPRELELPPVVKVPAERVKSVNKAVLANAHEQVIASHKSCVVPALIGDKS